MENRSKKNFYLVQIGVSYSSPVFLPYSVGCIAAYLKNDNEVTASYNIPEIVFRRERVEQAADRFDNPFAAAFSCFTWNLEYNKALAAELKRRHPECLIIFGGHSVPNGGKMLEELEFVDYLMHGEGEETTASFLKALALDKDISEVSNLSYRDNGKTVTTKDFSPTDISQYPSPYTEGIFDNMLRDYPEVDFHATLETNRGCPYACAYCEWCFTKKLRSFPLEKIRAEIDWISKNRIPYCYCADANFGILERDVEIARYVIEKRLENGYPQIFKPCYAKESDDSVFAAGCLLNEHGADKGVTLAYQSLDETALENIGRKNMTLEFFQNLDARYAKAGIPTYTELILGLPGETCDSFCKGICRLLESGQHNSMTVYECQVYPNTQMGDADYVKKFGIKTSRIPMLGIHYNPEFNGVGEFFDIITQTASMSKAEWVKASMFAVVLQTFHHLGLLRCFAVYLRHEKNVPYYDFYSALYDYIYDDNNADKGELFSLFRSLRDRKADTDTADWTYQRDVFGTTGWYFEEGAFLETVYSGDAFNAEITPFLKGFGIDKEIYDGLYEYQMSIIRRPGINEIEVCTEYDFYSYFENISANDYKPLEKINCTLCITAERKIDNWEDYAREIIWFGKRRSATLLTNPREKITLTQKGSDK